jgi:hypothetical protein
VRNHLTSDTGHTTVKLEAKAETLDNKNLLKISPEPSEHELSSLAHGESSLDLSDMLDPEDAPVVVSF